MEHQVSIFKTLQKSTAVKPETTHATVTWRAQLSISPLRSHQALATLTKLQKYLSIASVPKNTARGDSLPTLLANEATSRDVKKPSPWAAH